MLNFILNIPSKIKNTFSHSGTSSTKEKHKDKQKHKKKSKLKDVTSKGNLSGKKYYRDTVVFAKNNEDISEKPSSKKYYRDTVVFAKKAPDEAKESSASVDEKPVSRTLEDKAKDITLALEDLKPATSSKFESQDDEIIKKAKAIQLRTHNKNKYYKSEGRNSFGLGEGRVLQSIFEDEEGHPLPVSERQQILRELQQGKRKLHWK